MAKNAEPEADLPDARRRDARSDSERVGAPDAEQPAVALADAVRTYRFDLGHFVGYNVPITAALSLVYVLFSGPDEAGWIPLIMGSFTLAMSGTCELLGALADRFHLLRPGRGGVALLVVLYFVGGVIGGQLAAIFLTRALDVNLWDGDGILLPGWMALVLGLVAVFVGNLVSTYERLRDLVTLREKEIARRALDQVRLEKLRAEAELAALQAQINPHFLFNALNSLAALIPVDSTRAEEMTERLASVFRYVLKASREPIVLQDELDFLENYLALERLRFGPRLRVDLDVDSGALRFRLPGLLVQPLVENALKHGLARSERGGTVRIHARRSADALEVSVADDGPGFRGSPESLFSSGTGLSNVRDRLQTAYNGRASLWIRANEEGGTVVGFRIPAVFPARTGAAN